ncbi:Trimethylguanosine synthase [Coemansia sp. RSA 989]|nr:trimethylguanosine synthase-like protein [Coemansia mojavensis]KAJ1741544.1 Trimethylguanosine synthase [Coemansia sp. RSA 1086]KAJ1753390.1 Trimethylguanosine synthase [Coemansia sp. RSA 1821]KAJ1864159.1 Trimethylguanosine synthase [Coemansia sp. RSA 989]KAJ1875646.1 Trimethylguanosine synthase [Coemansia sp. RSA 990]KAJ2673913.1 Trimethylguanosine synthase [Coemansia sp. RSA 1085]
MARKRKNKGARGEQTAKRTKLAQRQLDQNHQLPSDLQKYWRQRHNFFWKFDEGILIDEEGWYSVTPEVIAEDTAARIAQLYNPKQPADPSQMDYGRLCVVDAFCGVGGNTIKFATWCEHVIAIDIDPVRLEMARHNARVYGVEDRIEFILGDFYELAPMLKADVVFMSPPWGGPEYTSAPVFDLDCLPFHSAREWLDRARLISSNIVYFMPRNCDPRHLADLYPEAPCDIELNYTNGFLKSLTVYYNDLALRGSSEPRALFEKKESAV